MGPPDTFLAFLEQRPSPDSIPYFWDLGVERCTFVPGSGGSCPRDKGPIRSRKRSTKKFLVIKLVEFERAGMSHRVSSGNDQVYENPINIFPAHTDPLHFGQESLFQWNIVQAIIRYLMTCGCNEFIFIRKRIF